MNRDFKGVWIPKEIWLNTDLSALDKVLLAEISSLDNEEHCFASNEYFSEFCGVSVPTITRSIKKLKDLGYIECEMVKNEKGSYRLIKVITGCNQNDERGCNQNDETRLIKMITNYNNTNNTSNSDLVLSKDNTKSSEDCSITFEFGKSAKTIKPNLYDKCISSIDEFTNIASTRQLLINYLNLCMEMKCIRGGNQWKGMLNTLEKVKDKCPEYSFDEIIQNTINHGWKTFYPITSYSSSKPSTKKLEGFTSPDVTKDGLCHNKSEMEF